MIENFCLRSKKILDIRSVLLKMEVLISDLSEKSEIIFSFFKICTVKVNKFGNFVHDNLKSSSSQK